MQKIMTSQDLKASILLLEIRQAEEGLLLKAQFASTYESLKPANLVKNALKNMMREPGIKEDLLGTGLSVAAGYISKRIVTGGGLNPIKNILGTLLQMSVTHLVAKNQDGIQSAVLKLAGFFKKKEEKDN